MADKEGWLFKKKRAAKNKSVSWTKRWFVLRGTQLTYFKSQNEFQAKSRQERSKRLSAIELEKKEAERADSEGTDRSSAGTDRSSKASGTGLADKRTLDIRAATVLSATDKPGKEFSFHITHFEWGTLTLAAPNDNSRNEWLRVLERASKAGHLTYKGALETLKLTEDASPADINTAYNTLVDKHRPENGGDAKSFQFYTNAYNYASQQQKLNSLPPGPKSTVTITKQSLGNGGLGLRVRMRAGGGIEVTQVLNDELKSDVEIGDVIMTVNGETVDGALTFTEFYELVKKLPEGKASEWSFMRPAKLDEPKAEEEAGETTNWAAAQSKAVEDAGGSKGEDAAFSEGQGEKMPELDLESNFRTENDPPPCSSLGCMSFNFFGGKEQNSN